MSTDELPLIVHTPLAAKVLGVSEQTFRSLCRSGKIPAVHLGRRWVIARDKLLAMVSGEQDG